jgi:hypothetical protein
VRSSFVLLFVLLRSSLAVKSVKNKVCATQSKATRSTVMCVFVGTDLIWRQKGEYGSTTRVEQFERGCLCTFQKDGKRACWNEKSKGSRFTLVSRGTIPPRVNLPPPSKLFFEENNNNNDSFRLL